MKIYKFQNGTKDYEVGVLYSTHNEELRLQSNDLPKSELYIHAASVVLLAQQLFGLTGLRATLREIVFSDGQHGPQSGVLLNVSTATGDNAKLALPKVKRKEVVDLKTKEVDPEHPQNAYNLAVDLLEAAITDYVQGRRLQAVLDFNQEKSREMQGEYTEEEEDSDQEAVYGRNLLDFAAAGARA